MFSSVSCFDCASARVSGASEAKPPTTVAAVAEWRNSRRFMMCRLLIGIRSNGCEAYCVTGASDVPDRGARCAADQDLNKLPAQTKPPRRRPRGLQSDVGHARFDQRKLISLNSGVR